VICFNEGEIMIQEKSDSILKALVPAALFLALVIYLLTSDPNTIGPY
jgi:hypothetical protein